MSKRNLGEHTLEARADCRGGVSVSQRPLHNVASTNILCVGSRLCVRLRYGQPVFSYNQSQALHVNLREDNVNELLCPAAATLESVQSQRNAIQSHNNPLLRVLTSAQGRYPSRSCWATGSAVVAVVLLLARA